MHIPVLLNEVINAMNVKPQGIYVDCTGGGGSHGAALLERLGENGRLILLDRDVEAVARLEARFGEDKRVTVIHANFADIDKALKSISIEKVDGIYADFGVSSYQLNDGERGFSFRNDGNIDMRMDTTKGISAIEVVNTFTPENLSVIIAKFGEERFARRIASDITKRRAFKKFARTKDLADVVKAAVPKKFHKKGIHPATQTFQALRIFVNGELDAIKELLDKSALLLNEGGRIATISFHSLEDRIVKECLVDYAKDCVCPPGLPICVCDKKAEFKIVTKRPILPSLKEVEQNPLSRSAKLRVGEKII